MKTFLVDDLHDGQHWIFTTDEEIKEKVLRLGQNFLPFFKINDEFGRVLLKRD